MAAKIGGPHKRKLFVTLRERHGDHCHWCGEPMDFATDEEPLSATIEHIIPKCQGGTNEQSNLRLAHKDCNNHRHDPPKGWRAPRRAHLPYPAPKVWA